MRFLKGDLPLRLASVALAASLWFVIAGRQTAERALSAAVELRNVPSDLELVEETVNMVDVRLRASPGLIDSLDPGKVLAIVDLAEAHEGEKIVQLTPERIQVPFGFRVVKITPSLLNLRLESTRRKKVPVRPRIVGEPGPGLQVDAVLSDPAEVQVAGPRSRVQLVESAFTEPVSVAGATHTVDEWVNVGLEDPQLRLEGQARVRVSVRLREAPETRVFGDLPVVARGGPARLEPSRVAVVVTGPGSQLRSFEPSGLRPHVEVPADGPASMPLRVDMVGGAGLAVVETRPAEVLVQPLRRPAPARP